MKIVIKTKNVKLNPTLREWIQMELDSLEKFSKILQNKEEYFNHFFGKGKPRVEAWVEIGKESLHHKKGPVFWVECQMRFPKRSLRATAQSENLKAAITEVKDELQRQLKQYKEKVLTKTSALTKRRVRVLKKELKLAPQARFWRKGRLREEGI
ncbi:MAG: ribosome-associated translation inhibitor RaiA [Patescibacteria group bacterium]|nr:ribosome-associated translation inhibitor RaiA [Patescibacteria group bacterium]